MAAWGRKAAGTQTLAPAPTTERAPKSLVASAISFRFNDASYTTWRFRDETWQRELWRLYNITPELRFAASWVGQCCSRVRIYVARVDELGRVQGEAKDPKIAALSETLLGGPTSRSEHLRMLGIDLTVAGECYIVGRPDDLSGRDEWYVLTPSEFRRVRGSNGEWEWTWGDKDAPYRLDPSRTLVTRVWTPHPERVWNADSPARACHLVLRELEQLTKYVAAQIDSRLVGAGVLVIPNDLDLPQEENATNNADSLLIRLATAGAASLRGEGTALGVLPHIIEAPNADGFKLLTFDSELSKQAMDLRREAVERLGRGMDMPLEVLSGSGSTNHWSGYLVEGQGVKIHIEPVMNRICDALTKSYLTPALKLMGKNPARYTFAFDTSPLIVRPQRTQDALNLYDKGLVSGEAVRDAAYFRESDSPTDWESGRRFMQEIVLRDPQLLQNQKIRELCGISAEMLPQEAMVAPTPSGMTMGGDSGNALSNLPAPVDDTSGEIVAIDGSEEGAVEPVNNTPFQRGSGPPPPPPPPNGIRNLMPPPMPDTFDKQPRRPRGLVASVRANTIVQQELGVVVLAEATVRRGLELAGKRLLNAQNRHRWPDVPHFELHTRIKVQDRAHANRLLRGAWDQLDQMTKFVADDFDTQQLQASLEAYCSTLLIRGMAHEPEHLYQLLQADGVIGNAG